MNNVRGQTKIEIDGREVVLCLTMGAIADIEEGLNISLFELPKRLTVSFDPAGNVEKMPRMADIIVVLKALSSGGDNPLTDQEIRKMPFNEQIYLSINEAINAASPDDDPDEDAPDETEKKT